MMHYLENWEKTLRGLLHGRFAAAHLFCLEEVGSTNAFLKERAGEEPGEAIAIARSQTAGVGRRGRVFSTVPGETLHLSFLLRHLPDGYIPISLAAGLAVQQALFALCGTGFSLKWPNDPLADNRKVGGILCEVVPGGVICGIGINLLVSAEFFTEHGLPHAASVQMVKGCAPTPEVLAAAIAEKLELVLAMDARTALTAYAAHCATLGVPVRVLGGDGTVIEGIADCITPLGELVVRTSTGRVTVRAGDVSVRGQNGYV
ncbi:MAG: biotin--[acetyl-CoA-carboxylase] ligase [Ethanoligenens sp.]